MEFLIIPAMAGLHRLRGAVQGPIFGKVRIPSVLFTGPLVGLAMWLLGWSWPLSLTWALGYTAWCLPSWARWLSLDHVTPARGEGRALYLDEMVIEFWGMGNVYACLVLRFGIYLIPLAVALWFLGVNPVPLVAIPALIVPIAVLSWRICPTDPFLPEELAVGLVWGCVIYGSRFL